MYKQKNVGVIVLAAGGSTRMGSQKLLLQFGGSSLVRRSVLAALHSLAKSVVVVVGYEASRVAREINDLPVRIVFNPCWQDGQGISISCGLKEIMSNSHCEAVILMVADQPFVTKCHLNRLIRNYRKRVAPIFVSTVGDIEGNPALFDAMVFPKLRLLKGDEGARQLFSQFEVIRILQDEPLLFKDVDDKLAFIEARKEWQLRHGLTRGFSEL